MSKRVLWLCNIIPPIVAKALSIPVCVKEGWISGLLEGVVLEDIELGICFPVSDSMYERKIIINCITAYGFQEDVTRSDVYDAEIEDRLRGIVEDYKPNIIHIFGTEYPHSLAMSRICKEKYPILVGLQGIMVRCASEYLCGIPREVINRKSFRDIIRKDGLIEQQKKFEIRASYERELLGNVVNVTGRTLFDRRESLNINPNLKYYYMNETMRKEFYEGKWNYNDCSKHTIMMSQGDYPLKGLHYMIPALAIIKKYYPDVRLIIGGNSIIKNSSVLDKIKISGYGRYLLNMVQLLGLEDNIESTGLIGASRMKELILCCNVFVAPSVLENSSNAVAEAMLLGAPIVASRVGGMPDIIKDGDEGILVEIGDSDAIAEAIMQLWANPIEAIRLGDNASNRAKSAYDLDSNYARLIEIYEGLTI